MKRIILLLLALVSAMLLTSARQLVVTDTLGEVGKQSPFPVRVYQPGIPYDAFCLAAFAVDAITNPARDFFTITGSDSATIYVSEISISATLTTSAVIPVVLSKRSTANINGTSATITPTLRDRNDVLPALATVRQYTSSATLVTGTLVGNVWSGHLELPAPATTGSAEIGKVVRFDPPVVLRGSGDVLAFSLTIQAPAGMNTLCGVRFSETRP